MIALDAVRKFEAEHQVRLPDDYVWFITNVGNGGTWQPVMGGGWDYQFYPLEKTYFSRKAPDRNAAVPDSETGTDKYALDVLSKGCSYSFGIILAGEHYGEISDDGDGDAFYNEKPVHGFRELYLKWLDEFSLGYDIVRFDERLHGTIEEHLEQYKKLRDCNLLRNIRWKVNQKCAAPQFVAFVYDAFLSEADNQSKVLLAKILIQAGFRDVYTVLHDIFSPENYETVISELYLFVPYFANQLNAEGVIKDAERYYPMLVQALRYYETAEKPTHFKYCFQMTVMNPLFDPADIMEILTSDDPEIVKLLAVSFYQEGIRERVGTYLEAAKQRYKR